MLAKGARLLTISSRNTAGPHGQPLFRAAVLALAAIAFLHCPANAEDECEYGPPNLLKSVTPFSSPGGKESEEVKADETSELDSISLSSPPTTAAQSPLSKLRGSSLKERLAASRMFLPERMLLGTPAKFTVKAKPGMQVAIAMADRDKGSKPICGHSVRLGPDRKVVAVSRVPESGVAEIYVETPIEGDLIGQYLYFEAAIWSKPDMSDLEVATTVTSAVAATPQNAVMVAQAAETKRGVNIVPDSAMPLLLRQGAGATSLGSGTP